MKIFKSLHALGLLAISTEKFDPLKVFKNKRVAIIGAADSAFLKKDGDYINNFDYVVRINKAPHSLTPDKFEYIGNRTDILFHSFYENTSSGGGPIDWELYSRQHLKFLVNPYSNFDGFKTHWNYYKRNLKTDQTFFLSPAYYKEMTKDFGRWIPTVGYCALYSIMNSQTAELYITGFTFFKTPYADGYRNQLKELEANQKHIKAQGLHNPDLELAAFIKELNSLKSGKTQFLLDDSLSNIVNSYR